ncbi:hypothetical protein RRF57_004995 [Xylaria bambusicola]|uniref:Cytochrome P450 n=1 Tax=Xylaria bambusicola TaxID=326684 RepID=A0AAN7UBB1_9PEZI
MAATPSMLAEKIIYDEQHSLSAFLKLNTLIHPLQASGIKKMTTITPIPSPPALPLVGNATQIDPVNSLRSFVEFGDKYGETYRIHLPGGRSIVFANSHRLINELCDEKRFTKIPNGVLELIQAKPGEEAWGIAHRVLMPAKLANILTSHRFGPLSIRGMFDEMHDVASQMALKFARYGSNTPIPASEDFTRLALDTLALCSMGFRFNSFYTKEMHPMIEAMAGF